MDKIEILSQLFKREREEKKLIPLSKIDTATLSSEEYHSWVNDKRDIIESDVMDTHWIKTCTGGYITEVIFHANGTLDEYTLFDRIHTTGTWALKEGILQVEIVSGQNRYSLNVVGSKAVNIHSAIEYENGELHSYLKLSQVK